MFRQHILCHYGREILATGLFLLAGAGGVAAQEIPVSVSEVTEIVEGRPRTRTVKQGTWELTDIVDGAPLTRAVMPVMRERWTRVALKTNLLFDAVGAPNLGAEVVVGNGFSAAADFAYAYWHIDNTYALQTIQGGITVKYWFAPSRKHPDRPLTGWNAAAYATYSSRYDVQWKDGWQGDGFWSAGIGAGYSLPVARSLNMEFALAAGWFYTPEVRGYDRPADGHLVWRETRKNVQRFSLTKVQANLVWLIGGGKR